MFKKTIAVSLLFFSALCLTAANGMKTFKLNNDTFAVKAGTVITAEVEFESEPGYVLAGWSANIIRKNSAPELFTKPEVKLRRHRTHKDYDTLDFVRYVHFPQAQTKGKFTIRINTAGMPAGDYAIAIQGRWMKDNKSTYPGATLYISITEADNKKFQQTANSAPAEFGKKGAPAPAAVKHWKSLKVTPHPAVVKSGEKVAFTCDYVANDGEYFGGYLLLTLRKDAPAEFFELKKAQVQKYAPASSYDRIIIKPYLHSANLPSTKLNFEIDTTGYPAGNYKIYIQFRRVVAKGNPVYPSFPIDLQITK